MVPCLNSLSTSPTSQHGLCKSSRTVHTLHIVRRLRFYVHPWWWCTKKNVGSCDTGVVHVTSRGVLCACSLNVNTQTRAPAQSMSQQDDATSHCSLSIIRPTPKPTHQSPKRTLKTSYAHRFPLLSNATAYQELRHATRSNL